MHNNARVIGPHDRTVRVHDLISTDDVARMLGVSRARVWQLCREDTTFPSPVWRGRVEMAWDRSEITAWAAEHRPEKGNDPRP